MAIGRICPMTTNRVRKVAVSWACRTALAASANIPREAAAVQWEGERRYGRLVCPMSRFPRFIAMPSVTHMRAYTPNTGNGMSALPISKRASHLKSPSFSSWSCSAPLNPPEVITSPYIPTVRKI
eukprot:scaffold150098_cov45-Prasinocladus_malaysianus.AAC.1